MANCEGDQSLQVAVGTVSNKRALFVSEHADGGRRGATTDPRPARTLGVRRRHAPRCLREKKNKGAALCVARGCSLGWAGRASGTPPSMDGPFCSHSGLGTCRRRMPTALFRSVRCSTTRPDRGSSLVRTFEQGSSAFAMCRDPKKTPRARAFGSVAAPTARPSTSGGTAGVEVRSTASLESQNLLAQISERADGDRR